MFEDSERMLHLINPIVEEHNKKAKLMNQIAEIRNKANDILTSMQPADQSYPDRISQLTRSLDKKDSQELSQVFEDINRIYKDLYRKSENFKSTDFNKRRHVKSVEDGTQTIYDENLDPVGTATFKDGKMTGEYVEHEPDGDDVLKNYFNTSSYVVDRSVRINENGGKRFEKVFTYSVRESDVASLTEPINPLAIVEIGYDEQGLIKYIRRKVYNRYIDKATFDKNGNLLRIRYNVLVNGHHWPHTIVYQKNGQFKYYMSTNQFLVEWGHTKAETYNSCSPIRAFGDYRMDRTPDGKLSLRFEWKDGAVVYFEKYFYALYEKAQLKEKDLKIPKIDKKNDAVCLEEKQIPILLDTTVSQLENRVISSIEKIPQGYVTSLYSYDDEHPYYRECKSDSLKSIASVSYLVPIKNQKMPLMSLIYNDDQPRVIEKNGEMIPCLLANVMDDGHNCNLERVKQLFFDFTGSGYEGLDSQITTTDHPINSLPEEVRQAHDEIDGGEIDEVKPDAIDEDEDAKTEHDYSKRRLPESVKQDHEEIDEGEIDEINPDAIDEGDSYSKTEHDDSKRHLPESVKQDHEEIDEGEIDEVKPDTRDAIDEGDFYSKTEHDDSQRHLPESVKQDHEEIDEGEMDELKSGDVLNSGSLRKEASENFNPWSTAINASPKVLEYKQGVSNDVPDGADKRLDTVYEDSSSESKSKANTLQSPLKDSEIDSSSKNESLKESIDDSGEMNELQTSQQPHLFF